MRLTVPLVVSMALLAIVPRGEALAAPTELQVASSGPNASVQPDSLLASGGSRTYIDRVGDNEELAPDITETEVTLSGGRVLFRVGIANLGPSLIEDEFVAILINVDRNPATGCSTGGADVALGVLGHIGSDGPALGRCVGGEMDFETSQRSFSFSNVSGSGIDDPGALILGVDVSQLGSSNFVFRIGSVYEGLYDSYYDFAGPFSFGGASTSQSPSSASGIMITRHPDVRAEATGPNGASVRYARAKVRGATTVRYSKPSSSVFPLGRTVVTITAQKGRRVARSKFSVLVADTTPPIFAPLPGYGTNATEPTRATVTFGPITATDRVSPNVSVVCTPGSGTVLAPGTTNVACTARDNAGNTAATAFRIAVPVYPNQMSLQTTTSYQYSGQSLTSATTGITIAVSPAADGTPVSYAWSASSGSINGSGATASWIRQLDGSGQPAPSVLTVTLTYTTGRTETIAIQFP